jgi:uncharacterized protein DUF3307
MQWPAVFATFVVSHLAGDFLLQTDWQARNKHGGLAGSRVARRALCSHVSSYTLAFVPALVWLAADLHTRVLGVAVLIAVPHLLQDDGRAIELYMTRVKGVPQGGERSIQRAVDQSFHMLALFLLALLVTQLRVTG